MITPSHNRLRSRRQHQKVRRQELSRLEQMEQAAAPTAAPIEQTRRYAFPSLWRRGTHPQPPLIPDGGRDQKAAKFARAYYYQGGREGYEQ